VMQKNIIYYPDCKHFRGDLPCKPHKEFDVHCESCEYYDKKSEKVLIIKLGAIGDVIRTTPLVEKIRKEMLEVLKEADEVEYVAIVDRSFKALEKVEIGNTIILVAAWVGKPRLIDNLWI